MLLLSATLYNRPPLNNRRSSLKAIIECDMQICKQWKVDCNYEGGSSLSARVFCGCSGKRLLIHNGVGNNDDY